jgi:hypothetical protein
MLFKEFTNHFFVLERGYIDNKASFMDILFAASGSNFFSQDPEIMKKNKSYKYKLFIEDKPLTSEMITSLNNNFNENYFVTYFSSHISDVAFIEILEKFGINSNWPKDKNIFLRSLCRQFKKIMSESDDSKDDIVAIEYKKLLREAKLFPDEIADDFKGLRKQADDYFKELISKNATKKGS